VKAATFLILYLGFAKFLLQAVSNRPDIRERVAVVSTSIIIFWVAAFLFRPDLTAFQQVVAAIFLGLFAGIFFVCLLESRRNFDLWEKHSWLRRPVQWFILSQIFGAAFPLLAGTRIPGQWIDPITGLVTCLAVAHLLVAGLRAGPNTQEFPRSHTEGLVIEDDGEVYVTNRRREV